MTEQQQQNFLENVVDWLHEGYPDGVPPKDYYPLLALLKRTLSEEEIVQAARTILQSGNFGNPVTIDQIRQAIRDVTAKEPSADEMHQVAARLASVGWPLAGFNR
jgi:hypothetical protein